MMILQRINRKVAIVFAALLLFQAIWPSTAAALTGGPTQPEVGNFKPIDATDMVDLFTGDFSYNIPLLDVDGYPINLNYQSNPGMDDEASWVGLGWSLNPGVINRDVRGFPDDFKADTVKREFNVKKDETIGFNVGVKLELFGKGVEPKTSKNNKASLSINRSIFYNTYRGWGQELGFSPTLSLASKNGPNYDLGLNMQYNSQTGLDFALSGGISSISKLDYAHRFGLGSGINSRTGLKDLSFQGSVTAFASTNLPISQSYYSSISFAQRTYFPVADLPLVNRSLTANVKPGPEAFGAHLGLNVGAYYTGQELAVKKQSNFAYGYLSLTDGKKDEKGLLDYNYEKERPYRKDMPVIPLPIGTYDLFTASGQGSGGQFRAVRNEVGILAKARHTNNSISLNLGIEIGGGNAFRVGGDVTVAKSTAEIKEWKESNVVAKNMQFSQPSGLYEPTFIKSMGENVATDQTFYNNLGAAMPIRVDLQPYGKDVLTKQNLVPEINKTPQTNIAVSAPLRRANREKRNQVFSYLSADEASGAALEITIRNYPANTITYGCSAASYSSIPRVGGYYKRHHISEATVTNPDGKRYVYGIPAYNTTQVEATFSVDKVANLGVPTDTAFGLVSYTPGLENSISNNKGKENYFDKQIVPAYAYAYLLTGVLSPDYIDRTNDGITEDDPGNAIKINYTQVSNNYQWRIPFIQNKAKYQAGRKADPKDDKGHYLYGKKELWYVHSIESRTMVAQFYISDRDDALGVIDENGGKNASVRMKKLDKIVLYSKSDLRINGAANATPIKTVNFVYGYNTCLNISNHLLKTNGGKLTLQKVYFTYGKSAKGSLNAYKFNYAYSPNYSPGNFDRWGNYQSTPAGYPFSHDYPYTLQDPALLTAAAWSLTDITLPSGGKINVTYELDDYAYVQNRRAANMFFIQGYARDNGSGGLTATENNLYNGSTASTRTFNNYIVVNTNGISYAGKTSAQLKKTFLEGMNRYLYFQANVLLKNSSFPNFRENISGYVELDSVKAVLPVGSTGIAIPIKMARTAAKGGGQTIHPITQAGYQTMRLELADSAYNAQAVFPTASDNTAKTIYKYIARTLNIALGSELRNLIGGYDAVAMSRGWAQQTGVVSDVSTSRSWIRLCDPDYIKYGGGSRVKKLTISDEWTLGGGASLYGQEYSYQTLLDDKTTVISSGVAAFEPTNGGEENPLREPVEVMRDENNPQGLYADRTPLAPTNYYYAEYPIGESLYPAPVVGYREVKVKNLTYANVSRTATGYSVSKFYTAKDFPVIADFTRHKPLKAVSDPIAKFFKFDAFEYVTATQGFMVEVNDMHGKPRSKEDYNESGALIRSVNYEYKVDNLDGASKHLNNLVTVLKPDGTTTTQLMGVDVDVWQDFSEQSNTTISAGIAGNVDGFFAGPFPVVVPIPIPTLQSEKTRLRKAATTKFIKRFGILEKVIVNENNSVVTTRNVLFDSETGDVLLTETQNEFDDNIYNFNYPAHWVYKQMGQSYANIGAVVRKVKLTQGDFGNTLNSPEAIFKEGDEVMIQRDTNLLFPPEPGRFFITRPSTKIAVMDQLGNLVNFNGFNYLVKIVRSGLRNQASTSIGAVQLLTNPVSSGTLTINNTSKVVNASAAIMDQNWKMFCAQNTVGSNKYGTATQINPFATGRLGNWRLNKTYEFYQERDQNATTEARPRTQGTVNNFTPFWQYATSTWSPVFGLGWTLSNTVTAYDMRGNAIETQNPIGVYATSQYGYNQTRVTAIADNAGYRDMAFEGFEDLNFNCTPAPNLGIARKISFSGAVPSDSSAHTGRYSLRIGAGNSLSAYLDTAQLQVCETIGSLRGGGGQVQLRSAAPTAAAAPSLPYYPFNCADCVPNLAVRTSTITGDNISKYEYNVSVWVATKSSLANGKIPQNVSLQVYRTSSGVKIPVTLTNVVNSTVIDGWMRLEGKLSLVPGQVPAFTQIELRLNNGSTETAYFDDFRMHPWKSNMKSFVYDPLSMRLMAELDENNFAMFYEYDDEGRLIRVKKETEKGVMTVKEARTQFKRNNP